MNIRRHLSNANTRTLPMRTILDGYEPEDKFAADNGVKSDDNLALSQCWNAKPYLARSNLHPGFRRA